MHRNILLTALFFLILFSVKSQIIIPADSIHAPADLVNVSVQKIAGDSLTSTFVIFIKENVPMHKHISHSENVFVLEGEGIFTLGSETREIKAGDLIFIPMNTFHELKVSSQIPMKVISVQSPEFDGSDRILYLKN
jgi:mannose-6-phosphate isomerase-like protein (cupin superfamily)